MRTVVEHTDEILGLRQEEVWNYFDDPLSPVTECLYGGAAGPGKTWLLCYWQIYRRCNYPNTTGLIGRFAYTDLVNTTMVTFTRVWNEFGKKNPKKVRMEIVGNVARFSNGSKILFRWLAERRKDDQDVGGLGSLELTDAAVDEVTECSERVIDILSIRIRYNLINGKPALLLCGNPAHNWVKFRFVLDKYGKKPNLPNYRKFVPALVDDNPDKEFVRIYKSQLERLPPSDRARLLYGIWDIIGNEDPWFHSFKPDQHIYEPAEISPVSQFDAITLSFDFNFNPCTVSKGQYTPENGLILYNCHEANGGTSALLRKIEPFKYQDHPGGLQVTGDVSGQAKTSVGGISPGGEINTDYNQIKTALRISNRQIVHTGKQNPRLSYSRRVVNHAFEMGVISIVRTNCIPLIGDLNSAMPGPGDKIIKTTENGFHYADNFRYMVHLTFPRGFEDINRAALLLTRKPKEINPNEGPPPGSRFDSIDELNKPK